MDRCRGRLFLPLVMTTWSKVRLGWMCYHALSSLEEKKVQAHKEQVSLWSEVLNLSCQISGASTNTLLSSIVITASGLILSSPWKVQGLNKAGESSLVEFTVSGARSYFLISLHGKKHHYANKTGKAQRHNWEKRKRQVSVLFGDWVSETFYKPHKK